MNYLAPPVVPMPGSSSAGSARSSFDSRSPTSTSFTSVSDNDLFVHHAPLKSSFRATRARKVSRQPAGFEWIDKLEDEDGKLVQRSFEWSLCPLEDDDGPEPASPASLNLFGERTHPQAWRRRLGPTEASYYLGSRGSGECAGVNDMYLHIVFKAKRHLVSEQRLIDIWTLLRFRHTLLASAVEFLSFEDIDFVCSYQPPSSLAQARRAARESLSIHYGLASEQLRDTFLNGERLLSDDCLAFLAVTCPDSTDETSDEQVFDFHLFSTHFIGDGMALHTTANEFFTLLSENEEGRIELAKAECPLFTEARTGPLGKELAHAQEDLVKTSGSWSRLSWMVAKTEHESNQKKQIGGHAFARAKRGYRNTVVPTVSYDPASTKQVLAKCKASGVSIAHAMFALSNVAYIRSTPADQRDEKLPTMLYSALNVRPSMMDEGDWYRISISYYNVILPAFMPKTISDERTFWHRSKITKEQTLKATKSKFMTSRAQLMAIEREQRSIGFERADLQKAKAALVGLGISGIKLPDGKPATTTSLNVNEQTKTPSTALMGLSMLGNLDGMYRHSSYDGIKLEKLSTGSRQRPGALLLFAYTFAGKLWLCLGYDQNGFAENVIESWWSEVLKGVDEFLLS